MARDMEFFFFSLKDSSSQCLRCTQICLFWLIKHRMHDCIVRNKKHIFISWTRGIIILLFFFSKIQLFNWSYSFFFLFLFGLFLHFLLFLLILGLFFCCFHSAFRLFNFQVFAYFLGLFNLLVSSFIPWWWEKILGINLYFKKFCWGMFSSL